VEAASMHLTIRLEVPGVPGTQALASAAPKPHSPILVVSGLGAKAPVIPASVHRLSAVLLPAYAQAEVSNIQLDRMQLLEVFELPHNLSVADFAKVVGPNAGPGGIGDVQAQEDISAVAVKPVLIPNRPLPQRDLPSGDRAFHVGQPRPCFWRIERDQFDCERATVLYFTLDVGCGRVLAAQWSRVPTSYR